MRFRIKVAILNRPFILLTTHSILSVSMRKIFKTLSLGALLFAGVSCSEDPVPPAPDEEKDPCETPPIISEVSVGNTSCGSRNGSIEIEAAGENGGLKYSLNGVGYQESNQFSDLAAGTYTVKVRDKEGCEDQQEVVVGESNNSLAVSAVSKTSSGCGTTTGALTLAATGGEGAYTYSINGKDYQSEASFEGLGPGEYTIYAKDVSGCSASSKVTLLSGISYADAIAPIIKANCAISGCHVAGTSRANFNEFAEVKSRSVTIKNYTQSGHMPPAGSGKKLTSQEVEAIACWVNDGAPEN